MAVILRCPYRLRPCRCRWEKTHRLRIHQTGYLPRPAGYIGEKSRSGNVTDGACSSNGLPTFWPVPCCAGNGWTWEDWSPSTTGPTEGLFRK